MPDELLSFACAMALDPSEVEVQIGVPWMPLDAETSSLPLRILRQKEFRRSRPKRSRVQEMAERDWGTGQSVTDAAGAMKQAIRAVCEYLAAGCADIPKGGLSRELAADVERHFLEPR